MLHDAIRPNVLSHPVGILCPRSLINFFRIDTDNDNVDTMSSSFYFVHATLCSVASVTC